MATQNTDKLLLCPYSEVIERDFKVKNVDGATVKLTIPAGNCPRRLQALIKRFEHSGMFVPSPLPLPDCGCSIVEK